MKINQRISWSDKYWLKLHIPLLKLLLNLSSATVQHFTEEWRNQSAITFQCTQGSTSLSQVFCMLHQCACRNESTYMGFSVIGSQVTEASWQGWHHSSETCNKDGNHPISSLPQGKIQRISREPGKGRREQSWDIHSHLGRLLHVVCHSNSLYWAHANPLTMWSAEDLNPFPSDYSIDP